MSPPLPELAKSWRELADLGPLPLPDGPGCLRECAAELEAALPELAIAIRLLDDALFLRMNGERAPGGRESWAQWERRAEEFLRSRQPA